MSSGLWKKNAPEGNFTASLICEANPEVCARSEANRISPGFFAHAKKAVLNPRSTAFLANA